MNQNQQEKDKQDNMLLPPQDAESNKSMSLPAEGTEGAEGAAAAMPPHSEGIMTAEGEFSPKWYDKFESLREFAPSLNKFRRPEALAKSYASLERMKGYPSIEDEKRMDAFRLAMGLPEKSEDYTLARPENTPDMLWDEKLVGKMAAIAHRYGIPTQAMQALADNYCVENGHALEEWEQQRELQMQQSDAQLQQEWGVEYEQNQQAVDQALITLCDLAGIDSTALAGNSALHSSPEFKKIMLEAARLLGEAPHHEGSSPDNQQEAYRIAHDPTHPLHEAYMRTSHPQHRYANEQYDRLAFGSKLSN